MPSYKRISVCLTGLLKQQRVTCLLAYRAPLHVSTNSVQKGQEVCDSVATGLALAQRLVSTRTFDLLGFARDDWDLRISGHTLGLENKGEGSIRTAAACVQLVLLAMLLAHSPIVRADHHIKRLPVDQLDAQFERNAAVYLDILPHADRAKILNAFEKIHRAKRGLVQMTPSNAELPTLLFVQGLDFRPLPFEWVMAFDETFKTRTSTYFFKWSQRRPFRENVDSLRESILELLAKPDTSELKIVAYSAGGVLAVVSVSDIADLVLLSRISLVTVASPFYGYRMPAITVLGTPFVGGTTIQLGRGIQHLKQNIHALAKLKYCVNWVTTNCDLDKNACLVGNKLYPQLGMANIRTVLPCGEGNVMMANSNDTHYSALVTIVANLISQLHAMDSLNQ